MRYSTKEAAGLPESQAQAKRTNPAARNVTTAAFYRATVIQNVDYHGFFGRHTLPSQLICPAGTQSSSDWHGW